MTEVQPARVTPASQWSSHCDGFAHFERQAKRSQCLTEETAFVVGVIFHFDHFFFLSLSWR
jgi:hypothetical protein